MKHVIAILAVITSLAGCAIYKPSMPEGYTGPTATVKDSVKIYSDSKADFYYVNSVDGNDIRNSLIATRIWNEGQGIIMKPLVLKWTVPARPLSLGIVARTEYAAPILAFINTVYKIKGVVEFTPKANRAYIVRGELGETYSAVWIEEEGTNEVVGKKVEINGSTKLGTFEK